MRLAYEAVARLPFDHVRALAAVELGVRVRAQAVAPRPAVDDRERVGEDVDVVVAGAGVDDERALHWYWPARMSVSLRVAEVDR